MDWFDESLRWYLTSLAAALAFAPLAAWLFHRLPGHGAWFARPVGMLATVWPVWFLASLTPVPYATWLLWTVVVVGGAVGWGLALRAGTIDRHWVRSMVTAELVFLAAFVVGILFRGYVPRIAGTEQPMDVGFLASGIRATDMPPRDEWFAGEPINYYYLGYLINGAIARMSGLPSWVAYNLALVGTFATTVVVTAGLARAVAYRIVGRSLATLAAAAGAFLIVIAGNMWAPIEFLKDPRLIWNTSYWYGNVGWESSRVIIDAGWTQEETITEFPSFSFILGDLHPHVTTLPFTILVLAIAVSLFLRARDGWRSDDRGGWAEMGVAGVAVGALYPMNSWDFPTYAGAVAVAVIAVYGLSRATLEQGLALGTVSILAWSPFWVGFVPFAGSDEPIDVPNIPGYRQIAENVGGYTGPWTTAGEYLTVFGLLWVIAMLYLSIETFAGWSSEAGGDAARNQVEGADDGAARAVRGGLIALGVVTALLAIALPAPVVLLSGIPVTLAVRLIARRWGEGVNAETVVHVLLAAGFGITLLTEFFYVRDTFNGRYNTLFKVYYQVWTLLGIGCAVAVVLLWQRAARSPAFRVAMMAGLVAAVALGSAYPVISGKTLLDYKNRDRDWRGLDGLAEHGEAEAAGDIEPILTGRSPDDVAAIRWLNDNAREGDVLLEAPGCQYGNTGELPPSRFSAFTGIPTVIGWNGSEGQWRGGQPDLESQIVPRAGDVSAMYEEPDATMNPLFDQYGITLLVVGDYERYGLADCEIVGPYEAVGREGYPGPGWTLEHEAGETRIYRRAAG